MIETTVRIIILIVALGMQICLHSFWFKEHGNNKIKLSIQALFALMVAGLLVFAFWQTQAQYRAWAASPLNKLLLPPYTPLSYFIGYVTSRIYAPIIVAIFASVLGGIAATWLNRRYAERFFELEEPYFFALSILCVGYPGFLFFIVLSFLIGILWSLAYQLMGRGRAPLYYLWFPTAILAILIVYFYVPPMILARFNF